VARSGSSKWIDAAALLVACGALGWSAFTWIQQNQVEDRQARFQRDVEERQSAPLLVPGVAPGERGRRITVPIKKRAGELKISAKPPRIVMPMRNVGEGVAVLFLEYALPVSACPHPGASLPRPRYAPKGTTYYVIEPGQSEQLSYLAPPRLPGLIHAYRNASTSRHVRLLLRYSDFLGHRVRWTCASYARDNRRHSWSVVIVVYGPQ
jgi:hypothetical protein